MVQSVYGVGQDLTKFRMEAAVAVLQVSGTNMDKAMVLVEQTWVFWLEDNLEDLEVGARCCENSRRQRCYWTGWVGYT